MLDLTEVLVSSLPSQEPSLLGEALEREMTLVDQATEEWGLPDTLTLREEANDDR